MPWTTLTVRPHADQIMTTSPNFGKLATLTTNIAEVCKTIKSSTDLLLCPALEPTVYLRLELDNIASDAEAISLLLKKTQSTQPGGDGDAGGFDTRGPEEAYETVLAMLEVLQEDLQEWIKSFERNTQMVLYSTSFDCSAPWLGDNLALARQSLAHAGRVSTSIFKRNWYLLLSQLGRSTSVQYEGQLRPLQELFVRQPFGRGLISSLRASFEAPLVFEESLDASHYSAMMRDVGRTWALERPETLGDAYQLLLEFIWSGSLETLRLLPYSPGFSTKHRDTLLDLLEQIDGGTRDSMLRRKSNTPTIVFVGAINAGKSTFLNMLIGRELLPTAIGPTTATPCRIRHVAGLEEPVLNFESDDLERVLSEIREGRWIDDLESMEPGEWEQTEPHQAPFFEQLRRRWLGMPPELWFDALEKFPSPDFAFKSPVRGAHAIRQTLEDINTLIRLCRLLPITYERFSPSYWPCISVEFTTLKDDPSFGVFELIDIPGTDRTSDAYQWNELTRQVLRAATGIIALISLLDFDTTPWRKLAKKYERQRTLLSLLCFSPSGTNCMKTNSRISIGISGLTFGGTSSIKTAKSWNVKPPFEELDQAVFRPGLQRVFPLGPRDYVNYTHEEFVREVEMVADEIGYDVSMSTIKGMLAVDLEDVSVRESARSLGNRLRRLEQVISDSLHEAIEKGKSTQETKSSDEVHRLVEAWDLQSKRFQTLVRAMARDALSTIEQDAKNCVRHAMKAAGEAVRISYEESNDTSAMTAFPSAEKADEYLTSCPKSLHETIRTLEDTKLSRMTREIKRTQLMHFAPFYETIGKHDPTVEERLLSSSYNHRREPFSPYPEGGANIAFGSVEDILISEERAGRIFTELAPVTQTAKGPWAPSKTSYQLQLNKLSDHMEVWARDRLRQVIGAVEENVLREEDRRTQMLSDISTAVKESPIKSEQVDQAGPSL
ncbi:hypothetical protein FRC17_000720, partial [Serendipita sp. 399]